LFSFGVVLYEMVTGALPYRGETSGVIFEAILNRPPVSPIRLNPDMPPKFEDILNRALEKDRELRYQHASEMRAELMRLKRDTDSGRAAVPAEAHTVSAECRRSHARYQPKHTWLWFSPSASRGKRIGEAAASSGTVQIPKNRTRMWAIGGIAALLIIAAVVAASFYRRANALTATDSILLTDFTN